MRITTKFSGTDEKEFLLGYLEFTSRIRIRMLKLLSQNLKTSKNYKEKTCYYILGLEQLLLLYESYQGFYVAFRDSNNQKHFLDSLNSENWNVQSLFNNLISKKDTEIIEDLNYKVKDLNKKQVKLIEERLLAIARMWSDPKFVKFMKELFMPLLNKLKHKMMLYIKDKEIKIVFEDRRQEKIEEIMKEHGILPQVNISLEEVLDIAIRLNRAIQDMIVLRLIKLGVKPSSLPVLYDDLI